MFYPILSGNNVNKETSFKILDKFVELGGNLNDTANVYSEGQSEEIIGEWMKEYVEHQLKMNLADSEIKITKQF